MQNKEFLDRKMLILKAIPGESLRKPSSSLERFHQEAEYLYSWCQDDKQELVSVGLDWNIVEDLPVRLGASRQAHQEWLVNRFKNQALLAEWSSLLPLAYDFRERLIYGFLYAFRNNSDLESRVRMVAESDEDVDIAGDLEYLVVLGRQNQSYLQAINYSLSILDDAEFASQKMLEIQKGELCDNEEQRDRKAIREAAYTHLREAVDTVCRCGRYALRRNHSRLRGYRIGAIDCYNPDRVEETAAHLLGIFASPAALSNSANYQ